MYFALMLLCFSVGVDGLSGVAEGAMESRPWRLFGGAISLIWATFMAIWIHDFDAVHNIDRMSLELQRDQLVQELANE